MVGRWLVVFERHSFERRRRFVLAEICLHFSVDFLARSHSCWFSVDLPLLSTSDGSHQHWVCVSVFARIYWPQSVLSRAHKTNWKLRPKLEPNTQCVARREIDWGARWNCCMNFYCVGVMNLILERSLVCFRIAKFDSYWMRERSRAMRAYTVRKKKTIYNIAVAMTMPLKLVLYFPWIWQTVNGLHKHFYWVGLRCVLLPRRVFVI